MPNKAQESFLPAVSEKGRKQQAAAVAKSIERLKKDADRVSKGVSLRQVDEIAEKYSRAPSTFLAAVIGGVLGSAGGIGLAALGGVVIVTGPLGLALGAAAGVLAFRGRNYWRLEKTTQKATGALNLIKSQIENLPSNAPASTQQKLYDQYDSVTARYTDIALKCLDD